MRYPSIYNRFISLLVNGCSERKRYAAFLRHARRTCAPCIAVEMRSRMYWIGYPVKAKGGAA